MSAAPHPGADLEVEPGVLLPGEAILQHWPAPRGRGALTNLRLLLMTHPHPIHRSLQWDVGLEKIEALEVEPLVSRRHPESGIAGPSSDGSVRVDGFDPWYGVEVNGRAVYVGGPNRCADLQQRIDDARTSRCMAVYGRLLPYHRADYSLGNPPPAEDETATSATLPAFTLGALPGGFLLFITGETYREMMGLGGPGRANLGGDQVYGPQVAIGRMVLDLASECGVSIQVIDVDHSGPDVDLVQRFVAPDDDLPILVRPDGARLTGAESFVPVSLREFLRSP